MAQHFGMARVVILIACVLVAADVVLLDGKYVNAISGMAQSISRSIR